MTKHAAADELPHFDLAEFLPYRLNLAAERLSRDFARRYNAEFGLTVPEWRVLVHLARSGDVSVRDIEARVAMEKSTVSRAASRLEAAGHVQKQVNGDDRRLLSLSLTPAGRRLMARLLPLALDYQRELATLLGERLAALNEAIDVLAGDER